LKNAQETSVLPPQQLRQLGEVRRHATGLAETDQMVLELLVLADAAVQIADLGGIVRQFFEF
jgi:hypothetical protein